MDLEAQMLNINKLPKIKLEDIAEEVSDLVVNSKIQFKDISEAPWLIKKLAQKTNNLYIAYKDSIYVPEGHTALATSKYDRDRVIATSKLLPWVYAIKNGSVSSISEFLYTIFNSNIRGYYFLFEYALLKSHGLSELADTIATGFVSTRKTIFFTNKNPETLVKILKNILQTKINKD